MGITNSSGKPNHGGAGTAGDSTTLCAISSSEFNRLEEFMATARRASTKQTEAAPHRRRRSAATRITMDWKRIVRGIAWNSGNAKLESPRAASLAMSARRCGIAAAQWARVRRAASTASHRPAEEAQKASHADHDRKRFPDVHGASTVIVEHYATRQYNTPRRDRGHDPSQHRSRVRQPLGRRHAGHTARQSLPRITAVLRPIGDGSSGGRQRARHADWHRANRSGSCRAGHSACGHGCRA